MKIQKSEIQKLIAGLSRVRRKSGNMQALATQEVYWLRKIVARLQFELRCAKDSINLKERQLRREKLKTKIYREIAVSKAEAISEQQL